MKKIFSVILCFVLICSLGTSAAFAKTGFTDLKGSRYATAIEELNDLDVVHGFTATHFGPDATLTRAQAATIFVNALYSGKTVPYVINFKDVYINTWCYDAINTAVYFNVVHGFSDGAFRPNDDINFNQMTAMVLNALGYDVTTLAGTWPSKIQALATQLGLYKNLTVADGTATITRGEACQMIYNALHITIVKNQSGKFVSTGKTLYEAMGHSYKITTPATVPSTSTPPTEAGSNPNVKSGQVWGNIHFINLLFDEDGKPNGLEVMFADDDTIYHIASIKFNGVELYEYDDYFETYTLLIGKGDELTLEMTYPNSGVYMIVDIVCSGEHTNWDYSNGEPFVGYPTVDTDDDVKPTINPTVKNPEGIVTPPITAY